MIRKSLLWGLTLVLVVAIIQLILRGRRLEKQQAAQAVEIIRQSKTTSTRILAPPDLNVVGATMQLDSDHAARHSIGIRNGGRISYSQVHLRFVYLDAKGKELAAKTYSVIRAVLPGATTNLNDIVIKGIPAAATKFQVSILYGDLGSESSQAP